MHRNVAIAREEGSTSWTKVDRDWVITANGYPELVGMGLFDVPGLADEAEAQYRFTMVTRQPLSFRAFWFAAVWEVNIEPDEETGGITAFARNLYAMQPHDTINTAALVSFANRVSESLEAGACRWSAPAAPSPAPVSRRGPLTLLPPLS